VKRPEEGLGDVDQRSLTASPSVNLDPETYEYGSVAPLREALDWALGNDCCEAILLWVPERLADSRSVTERSA
jgi:hypothetical protein